jgi:glucosamine-6-phosphate deaminase
MRIGIFEDAKEMGRHAAATGAYYIRQALANKPYCSIILATGASQFTMLEALVQEPGIDWSRIEVFHLDEYVGIPDTHRASFRKYLRERFEVKVSKLRAFHYIQGDAHDLEGEVKRVSALIQQATIEVAFIGIGENGHLAFNDPPANLATQDPYIIVQLDQACRQQQVGEGWFPTIDTVPSQAISMSVYQILKSRCIISSVPDKRKAQAIKMAVAGPIDAMHPAAFLRTHPNCYLMMDLPAAENILPHSYT